MDMITGKYCFVQFKENISSCEQPLPVKNLSDLRFFINSGISQLNIDIVNVGGVLIREFVHSFNYFSTGLDLKKIMAPGDCFRLKLNNKGTGKVYYSNVFVFLPDTDYMLLEYWCDKDEFGFHYEANRPNRVRIPAILHKPGYLESDAKYTDSNGRTRILYKEIRKKYVFHTDYISYDLHDKIKIALAHDLVLIDGLEYEETGNYKLGDEVVRECVDTVMGETEVAENFVERNTNC